MNQYYDVVGKTLELAETGQECLHELPRLMEQGDFEFAMGLYRDFIQSYVQMNETLVIMKDTVDSSSLKASDKKIQTAMRQVVGFLEEQNYQEAQVCLEKKLQTSYKTWHKKLVALLQPQIIM